MTDLVEWLPVGFYDQTTLQSLGNNSGVLAVALALTDPETGDHLGPGTIVGGHLVLFAFTADASALTAGRGPVELIILLTPDNYSVPALTTAALKKDVEMLSWFQTYSWIDSQTGLMVFRIDFNTKRTFTRNDKIRGVIINRTGAALSASMKHHLIGELYIQQG